METMTTSHAARASLTRARCPACRAPMVGTKATVLVSRRSLRDIENIRCRRLMISIYLQMRSDLFGGHLAFDVVGQAIRFLIVGIGAGFYVFGPGVDGVCHRLSEIRVLTYKSRLSA